MADNAAAIVHAGITVPQGKQTSLGLLRDRARGV